MFPGVSPNASDTFDALYDYPEPPAPPCDAYMQACFVNEACEDNQGVLGKKFNQEIRSPLAKNESKTWELEITSPSGNPIKIEWDKLPFNHQVYLKDIQNHTTIDMCTVSSYEYESEKEMSQFEVMVTNSMDSQIKEYLPEVYSISQNYPNPFNPETYIQYSVPVVSHVRILIYNTKGERIRTLVNGEKQAGYHSVVWNGLDEIGQRVTSGIYFYRMEARDFVQTRKVIMVK